MGKEEKNLSWDEVEEKLFGENKLEDWNALKEKHLSPPSEAYDNKAICCGSPLTLEWVNMVDGHHTMKTICACGRYRRWLSTRLGLILDLDDWRGKESKNKLD